MEPNSSLTEEQKQEYTTKLRVNSVKMVYPSLLEIGSASDADEEDEFKLDQSDSEITPKNKKNKLIEAPPSSLCNMENGICSFPSSPRILEALIDTAKKDIDYLEHEYIKFYSTPPSTFIIRPFLSTELRPHQMRPIKF